MHHQSRIILLALLIVFLPFGLVIRWMYRAIQHADEPEPEIIICHPSFWNQYSFYVVFPFSILGMGPVVMAYLALTQLDGDALLFCFLFLILWTPAILLFWIYCSYWKHDQHCTLRIFRQQSRFEYTSNGVVSSYHFSDVRNLTLYRSKRARGGDYIFYTEVELADGQCLLITCLIADFRFITSTQTTSQQTIVCWFPWLPRRI